MKFSRIATSTLLAVALGATGAFADPGENGHGHHGDRGNGQTMQVVQPQAVYQGRPGNPGRHLGRYRRLQAGYLSDAQIAYALQHRNTELAQLRSLRSIDYSRVRIVRLTAAQKARFGVGMTTSNVVAFDPFALADAGTPQVAQIFGGSNNGIGGILQSLIAGIVVQNVINNATGGGYGGGSSLANVLLNSGIPLSSLLGIFMGGNGILNALVG
jgi:hypothetical protein